MRCEGSGRGDARGQGLLQKTIALALVFSLSGCLAYDPDESVARESGSAIPDGFLLGQLSCDGRCIGIPYINETVADAGLPVGDFRIHTQWMQTGQTGLGFSILGLISYHGSGVARLFSLSATAKAPDGTILGSDSSFCNGPVSNRFGDCHEFLRAGQIMPFSIVIDEVSDDEAQFVHTIEWSVSPAGVYRSPNFAENLDYSFTHKSRSDMSLGLSNLNYENRDLDISFFGIDRNWNVVCLDAIRATIDARGGTIVPLVGKGRYTEPNCPDAVVYGIDIWND